MPHIAGGSAFFVRQHSIIEPFFEAWHIAEMGVFIYRWIHRHVGHDSAFTVLGFDHQRQPIVLTVTRAGYVLSAPVAFYGCCFHILCL